MEGNKEFRIYCEVSCPNQRGPSCKTGYGSENHCRSSEKNHFIRSFKATFIGKHLHPTTPTCSADDPERRRIAGELVKLRAARPIRDAQDPEASFYANLVRGFEASLVAVHSYPDYPTTGNFNRRLTWNHKNGHWEDRSEPGFECYPNGAEPPVSQRTRAWPDDQDRL
jgi:hypothetical protein